MRFLVRGPGGGGALVRLHASWQGLVHSFTGPAAQPLLTENTFIFILLCPRLTAHSSTNLSGSRHYQQKQKSVSDDRQEMKNLKLPENKQLRLLGSTLLYAIIDTKQKTNILTNKNIITDLLLCFTQLLWNKPFHTVFASLGESLTESLANWFWLLTGLKLNEKSQFQMQIRVRCQQSRGDYCAEVKWCDTDCSAGKTRDS